MAEALMAVSVGSSLLSGVQQFAASRVQAKVASNNAKVIEAEGNRKIAVEQAAAEQASIERLRTLQKIMGRNAVTASQAGISVGSSVVGNLNSASSEDYATDEATARFNLTQSLASTRLDIASQASENRASASRYRLEGINALTSSIGRGSSSLYDYRSRGVNRG